MSAFMRAREAMVVALMIQVHANLNAEMLGLPLPHPPGPPTSRWDDEDWADIYDTNVFDFDFDA